MKITRDRFNHIRSEYGIGRGLTEIGREKYVNTLQRVFKPFNFGTPIWEKEWEILVIIDACRFDTFRDMYKDSDIIESFDSIRSVGSKSPEWIDRTFDDDFEDQYKNTAYIVGNPYSNKLSNKNLGKLDEMWRYAWDENKGTIHPRPIIDNGIKAYRKDEYDRIILHLMQPHWPYISSDKQGFNPNKDSGNPLMTEFELQAVGEISKDKHLEHYKNNITYVMDEIESRLLSGVDCSNIVISSDHGEMFGEYGIYEHKRYLPFKQLRKVPWVRTTATNRGYEPKDIDKENKIDSSVDQRLEDLGYK